MSLAKELLERGERKTVLAYLKQCEKFWPKPELLRWRKAIEAGETPDFGANLVY